MQNIGGAVIQRAVISITDDFALQTFGKCIKVRNVRIDDQSAVFWKKLGEFPEGAADIIKIFEKVQVIRINIQDDADLREEMQEAVGVLTGFRDKESRITHPDVAADGFQDTSYGNGRIQISRKKDVGEHGCGGGLAVSA